MRLTIQAILITLFFFSNFTLQAKTTSVNISFYTETLTIEYDTDIIINPSLELNEKNIVDYFNTMETLPYLSLLDNMHQHKEQLQLNDWLYYELLKKTVDKIFVKKSKTQKTLSNWFLLSKSGFDTRLTYLNNNVYLYSRSQNGVYEIPMIKDKDKTYINLTSIHEKMAASNEALNMLIFEANPLGKDLSFLLERLPNLKRKLIEKELAFTVGEEDYSLQLKLDRTVYDLMKTYPIIDELQYLKTPLSETLSSSLIPQLKKIIKDKADEEQLQILAAFTRSAFKYKDDKDHFGKSKPMIPDEVFHYKFSDCEDRSALFFSLVKDLLDLPMIVIAYQDHLTIGVAIASSIGTPIIYNGKKYYICDPTGPSNSYQIGKAPKGYERRAYEILGAHN